MDDRRSTLIVAALSASLGLFWLFAAVASLEEAFVAAGAIGLAFVFGIPLLELRRRAGPGEAHFEIFPLPRVNMRGLLSVAGIAAVSVGWLLVGGVLGTMLAMLLADTPIEPGAVGLMVLVVLFATMVVGTFLTWEWFRSRIG